MNHYIRYFETFSCLRLIYGPQQQGLMFGSWVLPKPSRYEFLIGFLIWTPASKYLHLTTFSNMCVIFIHVLTCVICLKMPKRSQINENSDMSKISIWPFKVIWKMTTGERERERDVSSSYICKLQENWLTVELVVAVDVLKTSDAKEVEEAAANDIWVQFLITNAMSLSD